MTKLENRGYNQAWLARILANGEPAAVKHRLRAMRIWRGSKPRDEEMALVYKATKGKVKAQDFYELA